MKTDPSAAWILLCLRIAFADQGMMSEGISSSESESTCSLEEDTRPSSKMNSTVSWGGDWRHMIRSNPYPDICRPNNFASKKQFRFCILEQMWQDGIPTTAMRRSGYDLINEIEKILPAHARTDIDKNDCFINSRMKMVSQRQVPFDCYKPYPEIKDLDYNWFLYENINDLRFAFDYVMYDNTGNTRNEAKLWYLMLYLKKLATELPNPLTTAKIIDAVKEEKKNYCSKVRDLRNEVGNFKRDIRYEIRSLLQSIKDFKTNLEVIIHMEKLNLNTNIFEFITVDKWLWLMLFLKILGTLIISAAVGIAIGVFFGVAAGVVAGVVSGILLSMLVVHEHVNRIPGAGLLPLTTTSERSWWNHEHTEPLPPQIHGYVPFG